MDQSLEDLCAVLGRLAVADHAAFLGAHPELIRSDLVRELGEAVRIAVRVDLQKAFALAEAALILAHALHDANALATASRAKANALWFQGDCRAAVRRYRWAVSLFEHAGKTEELARTLSSSIQSFVLLGEYQKATAAAQRAREIFLGLNEPARVARVDLNLANILHRQNRYREALEVYESVYRQLLPYRDREAAGVALHNMVVCLIALDDFQGALATYRRVRDLCVREEMPLLVAQADYNAAYLYFLRGDYTRALALLRSTREIYKSNGDHYHVSLCDLDRSEIYLELSLIDEAEEMASASLAYFEESGMKFETARALLNLAVTRNAQGNPTAALQLFERARELTFSENNPSWPYLIDLYRALVLIENGESSEARLLCLAAAKFFEAAPMPGRLVLCLLVVARAALRLNDQNEAAHYCEKALSHLAMLDAPILVYEAHFLRGRIFEAAGNPASAYSSYQRARASLEMLRSSLQRQELKIGFMKNRLEVYTRLVVLCLAGGDSSSESLEEALTYVEAAKCRTLRDLVLDSTDSHRAPAPETPLDAHLQELREQLNWYYHRIEREELSSEPGSAATQASLRVEASRREHDLAALLLDLPEGAAVAAALRNSSPATLAEIRERLGRDAALLEYFAIDEQIFAAVVTTSTLKVLPLGPISEVLHHVRMLQFQLAKFRLNAAYVAQFEGVLLRSTQTHLRGLQSALIDPLIDSLSVRDLVVVPFGPLHSIPFHALFDGRQYLIDRFSICYEPSASLFTYSHREMPDQTGPSLLIGIDDPKLPFIREEIEAVARSVANPRVLFGAAATEEGLRALGPESALIHIATHGAFRQDNPLFSSIRLAGSHLTLYDLYRMNLPADLLTLSGCVTGLNAIGAGDELLGLTRGLLYAGARSLLLSLWEVDDRSTSQFMQEFYSRLDSQTRKADAVRAAMVALRKSYAHPYYWAPFKLTGRALTV